MVLRTSTNYDSKCSSLHSFVPFLIMKENCLNARSSYQNAWCHSASRNAQKRARKITSIWQGRSVKMTPCNTQLNQKISTRKFQFYLFVVDLNITDNYFSSQAFNLAAIHEWYQNDSSRRFTMVCGKTFERMFLEQRGEREIIATMLMTKKTPLSTNLS